jgi:N-acetylglutamate synthase-like GNAT family acetyltransferase
MSLPQGYTISADKEKLQLDVIHNFLSNSYWAKDIPLEIVKRSIENSLCFGVYQGSKQVGFARVISDYATFGYLADVFILEEHRGKGLSKELMKVVFSHPQLQGLRRFCLGTRDAHKLYEQFGFYVIKKPELWMEIKHENIYSKNQ